MKPISAIFAVWVLLALAYKGHGQPRPDRDFAVKAAQCNIAEIQAGKLALTRASSDAVKSFARMMVDDHTQALSELDSIVRKKKGEPLPTVTDAEHQDLAQKLEALNGKSFDDAYMQSQLKDHRTAIALFEKEASAGKDPELKLYATKTLINLRKHLEHAQTAASGSAGPD